MNAKRRQITRALFLRIPPFFGYVRHHPHDVTLPFTIGSTATMLQDLGIRVKVMDVWANGWSMEKTLKGVARFDPHIIFFDAATGVFPAIDEINKNLSAITVIFGSVPTNFPEAVSRIDFGLVGECEETAVELVAALNEGRHLKEIPGLIYWDEKTARLVKTKERPFIKNLDSLPIIDYALFDLKRYRKFSFPVPTFSPVRWGHVLTTRGCPYDCAFCGADHRQSYGRPLRRASAKRIAGEFEDLAVNHQVNAISIEDDCFTANRNHVLDICDEIEKRNLPVKWVAQTRVDLVDRQLMKRMKAAGCVGLSFGVESGNDRILGVLRKGVTRARIEQALQDAAREGLMLRLMFMIGNPTETEAEIEDTMSLALSAQAITVQIHYCTPYPGTEFFDAGMDDLGRGLSFSPYNSIHRNLSLVPGQKLTELRNRFYHAYYFSWKYFKLFLRQRLLYMPGQAANDIPLVVRAMLYLLRRGSHGHTTAKGLPLPEKLA